jgi:flagellar protein FlaG
MKIEGSARIPEINSLPGQRERVQTGLGKTMPEEHAVEQGQEPKDSFPGEERLIHAIEKSNSDVKWHNTRLQFSIHEKTKQIMVKVIDNETEEVIREIPPEKILNMVGEMLERTGLFVDRKA